MPVWKSEIRERLVGLQLAPTREAAIIGELAQHLEDCYAELLAGGATPAAAYRKALDQLRESDILPRELRRVERELTLDPVVPGTNQRSNLIADVWQDLRFGVRMLMKKPGFTFIAVLTLALGIGANTAIFSVVNALLLRPLPYRQPEQLVKVFRVQPDPTKGMLPSIWSYPRFEMLRDQNQSFAEVAGFNQGPYNLTGTNAPERLQMEMVSDGYFSLLSVDAVVGRSFTAEDAGTAALLGYGLWQRRFGGDTQVIGKAIELDKQVFTIVGVLPPGFRGQSGTADVWLPMWAAPKFVPTIFNNPNDHWFQVIARLKDGVSLSQAQAEIQQVSEQIEQKYPSPKDTLEGNTKVPLLAPLQAAKVDPTLKISFLLLLAAVGLVLLIACANVANLLLGRFGGVMDIEGRADIKKVGIGFHSVSPDYFKTLGITLLRGRVFTAQDRVGAPRVALINQTAAEEFFPGEDAIGKRLRPYVTPQYETTEKLVEIVGVVADVRYGRLEEAIGSDIYVSALQPTDRTQMLVVRSSVDPAALTAAVQHEVLALDRNVPLTAIQMMQERAAEVTSRTRFIAVLLGLFAGLALLLAGIGIYGVMTYSVSARTREVGIRMALGAQQADVIKLVLNHGMSLAGIGVAIGLLASLALTRLMKGLLFGVNANDPLTFSAITVLLLGVACLASWLPARRATKVDPLVALRHE